MTTTNTTQWTEVKDRGDSAVIKFEHPGQVVEGVFHGSKPAGPKGNLLFSVTASDGATKKFWETWMLRELLDQVPAGAHVHVKYTGLDGRMKRFEVRHRPA